MTWVVTLVGSIVAVRAWHNKELVPSWHGRRATATVPDYPKGDFHGDLEAVREANTEDPHRKIYDGPPP